MENITKIYLWLLIVAAVSLIAVDTVSANTYYAEDYPVILTPEYNYFLNEEWETNGVAVGALTLNRLYVDDIAYWADLEYVGFYWDFNTAMIADDNIKTGSTSFTVTGTGVTGSGTINYFVFDDVAGNPDVLRLQLVFDSFDVGTESGFKALTFSYNSGSINSLQGYFDGATGAQSFGSGEATADDISDYDVLLGWYDGLYSYGVSQYHTAVAAGEWDNSVTITDEGSYLNFDFDRSELWSRIIITDASDFEMFDDASSEDGSAQIYSTNEPFTLNITSPYDTKYLNYFYTRSGTGTNYYSVSYDDPIFAYDDFNLFITPLTGAPSLSELDYFSIQCWNEGDASPTGLYYENQAGTWYKWNDDTDDYDIEVSNPYSPDTSDLFTEVGEGEIKIEIFTNSGDRVLNHDGEITVLESANYATYRFLVYDGASNHYIHYPEINVYNQNTDTWTNTTPEYGNDVEVKLSKTAVYDILIQKTGYSDYSLEDIHPYADQTKYVYLYPEGDPVTAGHEYVTFSVYDGMSMQAIDGAAVTCNGTTKQTVDGYARFEVADNTVYTYSVTKAGYIGKDGSVTVTTDPVVVHISMVVGATPTPTATLPMDRPLTDAEREQAKESMRDQFYMWGPILTQVALVGAFLYLIKSWGR